MTGRGSAAMEVRRFSPGFEHAVGRRVPTKAIPHEVGSVTDLVPWAGSDR